MAQRGDGVRDRSAARASRLGLALGDPTAEDDRVEAAGKGAVRVLGAQQAALRASRCRSPSGACSSRARCRRRAARGRRPAAPPRSGGSTGPSRRCGGATRRSRRAAAADPCARARSTSRRRRGCGCGCPDAARRAKRRATCTGRGRRRPRRPARPCRRSRRPPRAARSSCARSLSGLQRSSSSRNAIHGCAARSMPRLRACATPRLSALRSTTTRGSSSASSASAVPSREPSSTTMTSNSTPRWRERQPHRVDDDVRPVAGRDHDRDAVSHRPAAAR